MILPENILKVISILSDNGFEAYVVGGSVRDMIMGKTPSDYDITTSALPEQIKGCFKDCTVVETGLKHGTVTVVMNDENIEITTFRLDGEYLDNRRPVSVSFTRSLFEDLKRRDFTMNAIAFNPQVGTVDPMGGIADIKNGIIRCVGDADKRFNEDGLRILRAIRFAAQTGFEIEEETARSISDNKNLIKNISAERIFVELKKLLCGSFTHKVIREYIEVLGVFIPEILPMAGFEQKTKYHYCSVLEHTLTALENSENDEVMRLAVFLHDIGKPKAHYMDVSGHSHFRGHEAISVEMARDILGRLKSDNETKFRVCKLIEFHGEEVKPTDYEIKKFISEHGFDFTKQLFKLKKADASAKAKDYRNPVELKEAEEIINRLEIKREPIFLPDLKINGGDLKTLGISGKRVGEILKRLLGEVLADKDLNNRETLLNMAEEIIKNENNE